MRKIQLSLFICFLLLFIAINSFSQQYNFKNYTMEEGLPQSTVFCIFQDSRGFIWVGTDGGGASRFDGKTFKTFNKKDGLSGNIVRSILEDSKGNFWFGTDNGVSFYDGRKFITITNSNGLSGNTVLALLEDSDQFIWAGTNDGGLNKLKLVNNDSIAVVTTITRENGLSTDLIFDMHQDQHGDIWLALYGGINILSYNKEKFTVKTLDNNLSIPSKVILSIDEDNEGNLWFGSHDASAFKIDITGSDSGKISVLTPSLEEGNYTKGLTDVAIWSICSDKRGRIWFATNEGGLNRYDGTDTYKIYRESNGLPNNQILCIMEDTEGNIWLGSGDGLSRFMGDQFVHYTTEDGLAYNQITSITQDKANNYWLGTFEEGLSYLSFLNGNPTTINYSVKEGLPDNNITSLAISSDSSLWIATQNGISNFDGKKFKNFSKEEQGLANDHVYSIFSDQKNILWCGTTEGIGMYDGIGFKTFNEENGLINDEVLSIIQDKQSNYWFGTLGGIARWAFGKDMTTFDEMEGLMDLKAHALAEDKTGNIWIGTSGGGLYIFDVQTNDSLPISNILDEDILSSDIINSLLFLNDSTLIVGTNKGFDKICFDKSMQIKGLRNYNRTDGFSGLENLHNSIYKDNNGNVWMGTMKHLTQYIPSEDFLSSEEPKTNITKVQLLGDNTDFSEWSDTINHATGLPINLILPYDQNNLSFDFIAIHYKNMDKVKSQYMLEGNDKEWSAISNKTSANYTNLKPGEYTFMVRAKNCDGVWNKEATTYSFIISKPFWKTWWYYFGEISFFLLLIGISFYINKTHKKSRLATVFTFLFIILVYEFINVSIEPYIDNMAGGIPLIKMGINVVLAISISPIERVIAKLDKYI